MSFLYPQFAWLYLAMLIPLLLAIRLRLQRSREVFPSHMILNEILLRTHQNRRSVFNQLIRLLILGLITTGAMVPMLEEFPHKDYILVIDPSLSMNQYPLKEVISDIRSTFNIKKIYFGEKSWEGEGPLEEFTLQGPLLNNLLSSILSKHKNTPLILLTDGQEYQLGPQENRISVPPGSEVIILRNTARNIFVKEVSLTPTVSVDQVPTEIVIRLGGEIQEGDRLSLYINDKLVLDSAATQQIRLSRYLENRGLNKGRVELSGDDWAEDNHFYFGLLQKNVPAVFLEGQSTLIKKYLSSIFPRIQYVSIPAAADICFTSTLQGTTTRQIVFLIPEKKDQFENSLRINWGVLTTPEKTMATGKILSKDYPIMDYISMSALQLSYSRLPGEDKISIGDKVIISENKNISFFHFSVNENQELLQDSLFLLFYLNDRISRFWFNELIEQGDIPGRTLLDENLHRVLVNQPGFYRIKDSSKYKIINIEKESDFNFLTGDNIKKKLLNGFQVIEYQSKTVGFKPGKFFLAIILISIAVVLTAVLVVRERA